MRRCVFAYYLLGMLVNHPLELGLIFVNKWNIGPILLRGQSHRNRLKRWFSNHIQRLFSVHFPTFFISLAHWCWISVRKFACNYIFNHVLRSDLNRSCRRLSGSFNNTLYPRWLLFAHHEYNFLALFLILLRRKPRIPDISRGFVCFYVLL